MKITDSAFQEEIYSEMEEKSPVDKEEIVNINGHKVHLLYYDNGRTQAWVKGMGDIVWAEPWEKTTKEEFLNQVKEKTKGKYDLHRS